MAVSFYGAHDLSASKAANMIPEIYSKKILARFYASTVLTQICNTNYQGEITGQGSKVIIRRPPKVTISDYIPSGAPGHKPLTYEELTSEELELVIDRAKSFSVKMDDILKKQSDVDGMNLATRDAGEGMKIHIDRDFLSNVYAEAGSQMGSSASPVAVSKADIIDIIVEMGQKMDEKNIPESDRFVVLPPWMATRIKTSDLKDASLSGDSRSPLRNGLVGQVDRFKIYQSNLLAVTDEAGLAPGADGFNAATASTKVLGGTKAFATFANQLDKVETLRLEGQFGDAIRGLNVYGFRVVQPDAGVCLHAKAA